MESIMTIYVKNPQTTYKGTLKSVLSDSPLAVRMNLHFCDWGRKGVHGEVVKCVSFYHTGKEHQKYTISILIYQKSLSWWS